MPTKPVPKQWENADELIKELRDFAESPKRWWKQRHTDAEPGATLANGLQLHANDLTIIADAVGRNTWRGFAGMKPLRPSVVFLGWATQALRSEIGFGALQSVTDSAGYADWLKKLDRRLKTQCGNDVAAGGRIRSESV